MERYARHIVYRRWNASDTYRPTASFDTLREAIKHTDELLETRALGGGPDWQYKVIDLEHIDLGDMLTAPDAGLTVARIRASIVPAEPDRCPACRGTGGGRYNDCPACDGNGVI